MPFEEALSQGISEVRSAGLLRSANVVLQPTLSVIMPNYNHAHHLHESLEAILSQSYRPMEIIVIDDASTDNSVEVIKSFAKKEPILRLIRNEHNMGVLHNIKSAQELASGTFIYGAAADDRILPGFLAESMNLLSQNPGSGLCSTLSRSIDEQGKDKGVFPSPVVLKSPGYISPRESLDLLRKYGSWIKGNTTIYRREALIEAGGFLPALQSFTDGFIQQVLALRHGACFIPRPLACFRESHASYSTATTLDMERFLSVIQHARTLMATVYKDLFPIDYAQTLERRLLWSGGVAAWYGVRRGQERYISQTCGFSGSSSAWMDKVFRSCLGISVRAQSAAVVMYWSLKYPTLFPWLLRRWVKRART